MDKIILTSDVSSIQIILSIHCTYSLLTNSKIATSQYIDLSSMPNDPFTTTIRKLNLFPLYLRDICFVILKRLMKTNISHKYQC